MKHVVVGVVGDTKHFGLGADASPIMYIPASQAYDGLTLMMRRYLSVKFIVRTITDPLLAGEAVREQMRALDPALPVTALRYDGQGLQAWWDEYMDGDSAADEDNDIQTYIQLMLCTLMADGWAVGILSSRNLGIDPLNPGFLLERGKGQRR
jgi:hypothetical protein